MQKYANLVEIEKCCQTHIFLQNFVSIQPRTSPVKFAASQSLRRPAQVHAAVPGGQAGAGEGRRFPQGDCGLPHAAGRVGGRA